MGAVIGAEAGNFYGKDNLAWVTKRNKEMCAAIIGGEKIPAVAERNDLSRERVRQIWQRYVYRERAWYHRMEAYEGANFPDYHYGHEAHQVKPWMKNTLVHRFTRRE